MFEIIDTSFTLIDKIWGGGCETQSSTCTPNLAFVDIQFAHSLADREIASQITECLNTASWIIFDIMVDIALIS